MSAQGNFTPPPTKDSGDTAGWGIAAMIFAIPSFLFGWILYLGWFIGPIAIVLALIGIFVQNKKGVPITALVLGLLSLIGPAIFTGLFFG